MPSLFASQLASVELVFRRRWTEPRQVSEEVGNGIWNGELLHCKGKKIAKGCLKLPTSFFGWSVDTHSWEISLFLHILPLGYVY